VFLRRSRRRFLFCHVLIKHFFTTFVFGQKLHFQISFRTPANLTRPTFPHPTCHPGDGGSVSANHRHRCRPAYQVSSLVLAPLPLRALTPWLLALSHPPSISLSLCVCVCVCVCVPPSLSLCLRAPSSLHNTLVSLASSRAGAHMSDCNTGSPLPFLLLHFSLSFPSSSHLSRLFFLPPPFIYGHLT
jgi:hypothetical protein